MTWAALEPEWTALGDTWSGILGDEEPPTGTSWSNLRDGWAKVGTTWSGIFDAPSIVVDDFEHTRIFSPLAVQVGHPPILVSPFTVGRSFANLGIFTLPVGIVVQRFTVERTFAEPRVQSPTIAWFFVTPVRPRRWNGREGDPAKRAIGRWFAQVDEGVAVLEVAGQFVESAAPTHDDLEAADAYWLGGRRHQVTPDQAEALTAAGYVVTSEEV